MRTKSHRLGTKRTEKVAPTHATSPSPQTFPDTPLSSLKDHCSNPDIWSRLCCLLCLDRCNQANMASYERRSAVCIRCSEIKQGCRGGIPCERCTRLSLPCRPRNSSDSPPCRDISLTIGNEPAQQPKARIRRVQTGCLTCKKRKKKCDERFVCSVRRLSDLTRVSWLIDYY